MTAHQVAARNAALRALRPVGARALSALRVSDVALDEQGQVRPLLRVPAAQGEVRIMLDEDAVEALDDWLCWRPEVESDALWLSGRSRRGLNPFGIRSVLRASRD